LLVTLLLSTGVPMLLAGDERWRTQNGNNNAYVQDNATSWLSWAPSPEADDLLALTRRVIALRRASPVLRQRAFFEGRPLEDGSKDLAWFHPSGRELIAADWFDSDLRTLGMYLDGRGLRSRGPRGERIIDESYLLVLHSGDDPVSFTLPGPPWAESYEIVIDTASPAGASTASLAVESVLSIGPRATLLLRVQRT
jgi:glycogen operon protein